MKFEGKVYAGNLYLGIITSDSLAGLKRKASNKCNKHFAVIDSIFLFRVNDSESKCVTLSRINKKAPNNTIKRGQWK